MVEAVGNCSGIRARHRNDFNAGLHPVHAGSQNLDNDLHSLDVAPTEPSFAGPLKPSRPRLGASAQRKSQARTRNYLERRTPRLICHRGKIKTCTATNAHSACGKVIASLTRIATKETLKTVLRHVYCLKIHLNMGWYFLSKITG